jgi:hypothetical protein
VETESGLTRAEELVRLLAAASASARLYPPASELPRQAADKFARKSNGLSGPVRYIVEPHGIRVGDDDVAAGNSQAIAFAEALHAMQVGQLVIAPGLTLEETTAFIAITNSEPSEVRANGGVRTQLGKAGVSHLAVIEVTLRTSEEGGLLGLDLTTAPLDEIAHEIAASAERRAAGKAEGDEMADAISRLEDATRAIAMERVAQAMMRLDEATRQRMLSLSLTADSEGQRAEGILSVVAQMKPATLARLLTLVAAQLGTEPSRIAGALRLPPDTAKMLGILLEPRPSYEPDFGKSTPDQAAEIATTISDEPDDGDVERQVSLSSPALASARALATATSVSRTHLDIETVRGMSEVLGQAARDGAFPTVREALRRLDEIAGDPLMADEVLQARAVLADPTVLADVCRAPETDADAAMAGEILVAAGPSGAEALLDAYVRVGEPQRSLLRPVLRGLSEGVLGAARSHLRSADPKLAVAILYTLPQLGDRRAVPVIAQTLDSLDEQVRFAAVTALASMPVPEATQALARALNHREPETVRHVVRELGRARNNAAVPALSRALEDINVFARTYETRKEIIGTLEQIGTPEAEKALRGFAQRVVRLGKKTRELRDRAIKVADELARKRGEAKS